MKPNLEPKRRIDIITAINELDLGEGGGGECDCTAGDAIEIEGGVISVEFASDPDFMDYMGVQPEPEPSTNARTWGALRAYGFQYPNATGALMKGRTWGQLKDSGCSYYVQPPSVTALNRTWEQLKENGFAVN